MSDTDQGNKSRSDSVESGQKRRVSHPVRDDDDNDFKDFDDDDDDANVRKSDYDDDDDDDNDQDDGVVDLDKFMLKKPDLLATEPAPVVISLIDVDGEEIERDEEEEEEEEEEDVDEGEEEGDYETDEEEEMEYGPSDEYKVVETLSQEQLRLQREYNRKIAKEKKKALIKQYLNEKKRYHQIRKRNTILGFKITAHLDMKQQTVEKYIQMQKDAVENAKEAERLKRLHFLESCQAFQQIKQERGLLTPKKKKRKSKRKSSNKPKSPRQTRFAEDSEMSSESSSSDTESTHDGLPSANQKHDLTVGELKELYLHTVQAATTKRMKLNDEERKKCEENKVHFEDESGHRKVSISKPKRGKQAARFSFNRSIFLGDVIVPKVDMGKKSKLMNITMGNELNLRLTKSKRLTHTVSYFKNRRMRFITAERASRFHMSKEARQLSKSKSRMALQGSKQNQKILIETADVELKNLEHFKYEFTDKLFPPEDASPSALLREEVIRTLKQRHIPITHLKWPIQAKGNNKFTNKTRYGRIRLKYTKLTHQENEHPHMTYRTVLTNIAFFRLKQLRLREMKNQNQTDLEDMKIAVQQLLRELTEGLRSWASLSGTNSRERHDAKKDTEKFIQYFKHTFNFALIDLFIKLYSTIHSNEFALRRLTHSEGKGEGGPLHEFKDILRCREKLKAEHRSVQKFILRYQARSARVLDVIRNTDRKAHEHSAEIKNMRSEIHRFKAMLTSITEGLNYCQYVFTQQKQEERELKYELGISANPRVMGDYQSMRSRKMDDRIRKQELIRKYNSTLRQLRNINPAKYNKQSLK